MKTGVHRMFVAAAIGLLILLSGPLPVQAADSAVILMYHRFGESAHPSTNIRLDQFDAHLEELQSGGYTVLSVREILAILQAGQALPERTVGITIDDAYFQDYRRDADFIQRHVFPGGMLPSPSALRREVEGAGLVWREDHWHGADYARTLALWHGAFEDAWPRIRDLGFDERFRRLWRYYLAYCEAGFNVGRIDLLQLGLSRD